MGIDLIIGEATIHVYTSSEDTQEEEAIANELRSKTEIHIANTGHVTVGIKDKQLLEDDKMAQAVDELCTISAVKTRHGEEKKKEDDPWMDQGQNSYGTNYKGWAEFVRVSRLEDLFDEREGTLTNRDNYPGAVLIRKTHVERIEEALKRVESLGKKGDEGTLRMLKWFQYWMSWAVKNCKIPVLYSH